MDISCQSGIQFYIKLVDVILNPVIFYFTTSLFSAQICKPEQLIFDINSINSPLIYPTCGVFLKILENMWQLWNLIQFIGNLNIALTEGMNECVFILKINFPTKNKHDKEICGSTLDYFYGCLYTRTHGAIAWHWSDHITNAWMAIQSAQTMNINVKSERFFIIVYWN